jgi:8-oxo-dGTP pyrophosphatase MutT (NUDIX family)
MLWKLQEYVEIPGGKIEPPETKKAALIYELREEF